MELTEQETHDIHKVYDELRSEKETNSDLRKLIATAVSKYRLLAKDAEDLANRLYSEASALEDKARSL